MQRDATENRRKWNDAIVATMRSESKRGERERERKIVNTNVVMSKRNELHMRDMNTIFGE